MGELLVLPRALLVKLDPEEFVSMQLPRKWYHFLPNQAEILLVDVILNNLLMTITTSRDLVKTPLDETLGQDTMAQLFSSRLALGKMAQPEEITKVTVFLQSDAAAYLTGSVNTRLNLYSH